MFKSVMIIASCFAILAVLLGAFGAHSLENLLSIKNATSYETAVKYQFYHSFAIYFCGFLIYLFPNKFFQTASKMFIVGIILFCGSLYLIVYLKTYNIQINSFIGIITPIGGICFILGWVFLILGLKKIDIQ